MKRFVLPPEPPAFVQEVRRPGIVWLEQNPGKRPPDRWTPYRPALAAGFLNLCAYTAIFDAVGTVDHYLSCRNHPELAYEWSNYRYASQWVNSSKQILDEQILDPFEVEDTWFRILLPSLQLVLTDAVPDQLRECAAFTLQRLRLQDGERVIRARRAWYALYQAGELSLEGLRRRAPLIARAISEVERDESSRSR